MHKLKLTLPPPGQTRTALIMKAAGGKDKNAVRDRLCVPSDAASIDLDGRNARRVDSSEASVDTQHVKRP